jgi:hypothetical protein
MKQTSKKEGNEYTAIKNVANQLLITRLFKVKTWLLLLAKAT